MIRAILAVAALLLLAPLAQAASFDCGKAQTSFERAVCDHPDLSDRDEVLAQAYATALGGLSPAASAQVKAGQHSWLDYASRVCSDDAQPIKGDYTDDQAQCLAGEFTSRITSLEASRMMGGYRFYPVERYLVEQDTDPDSNEFNKVATKHVLTVRIDRDNDLAAAFNAMTHDMLLANDVQMGEDAHLFKTGSDELATGDTSADIDVTTTVKTVTTHLITLVTDTYWYGHGAAHGNYGSSYDHFLIDQKRPLRADDIFAAKGWEKTFGQLVVDRAKAELADEYQGDTDESVATMAADPARWSFTEEGLVVLFNPYEVASYARGSVEVTVPWDALADLTVDNVQDLTVY
ncbi:MAG TPA: DUF3298 domain-containing protein [Devosia sp.]|nr:DUF3298 domain-containing protein [Devosia sp.]